MTTTTTTCPHCAAHDANRVRAIAHANRLRKFATAELTTAIDILAAGMDVSVAMDTIRDAMNLLDKMPRN